jgi:NAD kinase
MNIHNDFPFQKILLFYNSSNVDFQIIKQFYNLLKETFINDKIELFDPIDISNETSKLYNLSKRSKTNNILLINFGGDGSLFSSLSTTMQLFDNDFINTISFNFGNKGFYCFYSKELLKDFISKKTLFVDFITNDIKNNNYIEGYFWEVITENNPKYYFLGDIVIKSSIHYKTIRLGYTIEDIEIEEIADGIIVFTSFGSSGYFLSINGTYIDPSISNLIGITFIAPHSLKHRPHLFQNKEIAITNKDKREAILLTDGQSKIILKPNQTVKLKKTNKKFILIGEKNIFKRWIKTFY